MRFFKTLLVYTLVNVAITSKASSESECRIENCPINGETECGIVEKIHETETNPTRGFLPWIVAIFERKSNKYLCGGTLISSTKIVSAAHCFLPKSYDNQTDVLEKLPSSLKVKLGAYNLSNEDENHLQENVKNVNFDPTWSNKGPKYIGDIAVLELENKVTYSKYIKPICLMKSMEDQSSEHQKGVVAGWGKTKDSEFSAVPIKIKIPIIDVRTCYESNSHFADAGNSKTSFCAGEDKSAVCSGDSGSGFYQKSPSGRYFLKGVVSFGDVADNCMKSFFAFYTDATKYFEFFETKKCETCESLFTPDDSAVSIVITVFIVTALLLASATLIFVILHLHRNVSETATISYQNQPLVGWTTEIRSMVR